MLLIVSLSIGSLVFAFILKGEDARMKIMNSVFDSFLFLPGSLQYFIYSNTLLPNFKVKISF